MNCRIIQDNLTHAADGVLSASQQATVAAHVKSCAACRQFTEKLDAIPKLLQNEVDSVSLPDADEMWDKISAKLNTTNEQPTKSKSRKVAPIIWLTAPLAAAAALFFAFLPQQKNEAAPIIAASDMVLVDYVEIEDPDSTAMLYVDKQSGWLVVWADDPSVNRG